MILDFSFWPGNGLVIGLTGARWSISGAFFKPGPLVRAPGPTLAENRPKIKLKSRFMFPNIGPTQVRLKACGAHWRRPARPAWPSLASLAGLAGLTRHGNVRSRAPSYSTTLGSLIGSLLSLGALIGSLLGPSLGLSWGPYWVSLGSLLGQCKITSFLVLHRAPLLLSGSLAIRYSDVSGFRPIFCHTPQNPSRTTGLVLQSSLHQQPAPQTNSNAIS